MTSLTRHVEQCGDQWLRLRRLEYQVEALSVAVVNLASAVDAIAFASAEPHAARALRSVHRLLDEIGVETAARPVAAVEKVCP